MQKLPHSYDITATAQASSTVTNTKAGLPDLEIAPPASFDGPGDIYSPEDLLVASIASCFILSFRAIAGPSRLDWESISVDVAGTLDSVERAIQFTGFETGVSLSLAAGASREKAEKLLHKADQACFITNSLKAPASLELNIVGGE